MTSQLAVVIASLARHRASLAIGNIVGSAISNILGAFSLGLLLHNTNEPIDFDRSSRIYSLVLLILTTCVTPILCFPTKASWLSCGSILILSFGIYIGTVGWAISKGTLVAPEDSDSDESSDDESTDEESTIHVASEGIRDHHHRDNDESDRTPLLRSHEHNSLAVHTNSAATPNASRQSRQKHRGLPHHVSLLIFGFLAIGLAGYVLSHAATTITDEFRISDVFFGIVILAIATTLPEKFIAIMSGHRGHAGILVANTAGSNIFLITLCSGLIMIMTKGKLERGNVNIYELGVLWGSTFAFTATVWFGESYHRCIGLVMLTAYIAFVVLELTIFHSVALDD